MNYSETAGANTDSAASPLDRAATRSAVHDLYAGGLLNRAARDAALGWLSAPLAWWYWASNALLFVGSALLLAGVVFFFAFNWSKIPPLAKFTIIESGLLITLIAAWRIGLERIAGKVLLLAAALLVGVFLAVFGQIYQTGADAYELFTSLAMLVAGWVLISNFAALWMVWLTLINTGLILYWAQVVVPSGAAGWESVLILLAVIDGVALAAREYGLLRWKMVWTASAWVRSILGATVLFYLTVAAIAFVVGAGWSVWSGLTFVVALAIGTWFYRYRAGDLLALTFSALAVCFVSISLIGRVIFNELRGSGNEGVILIFGLIVVGVFSVTAFGLRAVGRAIAAEQL
ncbi:MAG: DUF2157 domain-containing protein [Acidobacteriota bacterium]|nr:DUF2157 domain-containing protein [Acidobacteriota bacterium]